MPRRAKELTAAKVRTGAPGRHCDGEVAGLYLYVRDATRKYWLFRYTPRGGKMREMGLGAAVGPGEVSLAEARKKAREQRELLRAGKDPLDERDAKNAKKKADDALAAAKVMTFDQCAGAYIKAHEAAWRNAKHRQQWANTLRDHASPIIGGLPVASIDTGLIMRVLEPMWTTKSETASRVRGRIESILDWARVRGYREGENPARWRGHLDHLLPSRRKMRAVKHHAAMPWPDVPGFMAGLRERTDIPAKALEFCVLTATRSGEVFGAQWSEIDFVAKVWTVPAHRTKANREHRVPLSDAALRVLERLPRIKGEHRVFPVNSTAMASLLRRLGVNCTVHGFRSSIRDWCGEETHFPREVAEAALAHAVGDEVERAYRRGDALEKRRKLMDAWASFCERPEATGEVIPLKRGGVHGD